MVAIRPILLLSTSFATRPRICSSIAILSPAVSSAQACRPEKPHDQELIKLANENSDKERQQVQATDVFETSPPGHVEPSRQTDAD